MATPSSAKEIKARANRQPTTAKQWKKRKAQVIELPSGVYATIRRPGMEKFLEAGFLPDALASVMREQLQKAKGRPDRKLNEKEILEKFDENDVNEMLDTMDRVAAYCMTEPPCQWHKRPLMAAEEGGEPAQLKDSKGNDLYEVIPDDDRDEDVVYTDDIDQEDKNFIFQYAVGGSADLARFRATEQSFVDAMAASRSVVHEAEPDSRAD